MQAYNPRERQLRDRQAALKKPEWSSTFDLGVGELDRDHRELFRLVGEVRDAIEAKDYARCHALASRFIDDLERHFAREEAFLASIHFPDSGRHKASHRELLKKAQALREACDLPNDGQLLTTCYASMLEFLFEDVVRCDGRIKSHVEYFGHTDRPDPAVAT